MTELEKELFEFSKECVNHLTKDGYELIKRLYVLEKKLEESKSPSDQSIHNPIVKEERRPEKENSKIGELTEEKDLLEDVEVDMTTGEIKESDIMDGVGEELDDLPF